MPLREILIYPPDEARLRQKSAVVKRLDAETRALIADLKDTLLAHPGAGLSAPQIGVLKRVAVVRFGQEEGDVQPPFALVNPQIIERGPLETGFDGCLSVPNLCTWDTPRPAWLVFTAKDEHGHVIKRKVSGIDARLVHHEVDHLDGTLFLDRMNADSKLYLVKRDENGEQQFVEVSRLPTSR